MSVQLNPKDYVEKLCEENGKNDGAGKAITDALETLQTGFVDVGCFIREFLQNASDQAEIASKVTFVLTKNELIFVHNGKLFDQNDVKGISSFANADGNQKAQDSKKEGFKDLGFKSVLKEAWRVDIWSGQWHFNFNERNERWKRNEGDWPFPWQLAPFWTEESELSAESKEYIASQENTTFICQLRDRSIILQELERLVQHPEDIIFLRKIQSVSVLIDGRKFELFNQKQSVAVNQFAKYTWERWEEDVAISSAMKMHLKSLNAHECPKRLQEDHLQSITLSFCYPTLDSPLAGRVYKLFCTLPLGIRPGWPFLVSAPFLLNPSREALLDKDWNIFLIQAIATSNFNYFKKCLTKTPKLAFKILAPDDLPGVSDRIGAAYRSKMQELFGTAFLPAQGNRRLLSLQEAVVDPNQFYHFFVANGCELKGSDELVSTSLDVSEIIQRFPKIKQITFEEIIRDLPRLIQKNLNPGAFQLILLFFSKIFRSGNRYDPAHLELFKNQECMLTHQGGMTSLANALLYPLDREMPLPSSLPLTLIEPRILNPELLAWLNSIGIKYLSPQDILSFLSARLASDFLKQKENNLSIIKLIFYLFNKKAITVQQLKSLIGIPLFAISNQAYPSNQLYFSENYEPKFNLQQHLPLQPQLFISSEYIGDEIKLWKAFFLTLGVVESCEFEFTKDCSVKTIRTIPYSYIKNYLDAIFAPNNPQRPAKTKDRLYKDEDSISPFVSFPYVEWMTQSESFREFFWQALYSQQEKILKSYTEAEYRAKHVSDGNKKQIPWLRYIFQFQNLVIGPNGAFCSSESLYASSMRERIGDILPTAHLPVLLSPKMEEFLGFKTRLTLEDCFTVLEHLQRNFNYDSYLFVMQNLFHTMKDQPRLRTQKQWKFLAANNTWSSPTSLKLWGLPNLPPENACWIKSVPEIDMVEFCQHFGIEEVSQLTDDSVIQGAVPDTKLKNRIFAKIPEIAFELSHCRNEKDKTPRYYVNFLLTKIREISFFVKRDLEEDSETSMEQEVGLMMFGSTLVYFESCKGKKDLLSQALGKFLSLGDSEIKYLLKALKNSKPFRGEAKKSLDQFKAAFDLLSLQNAPVPQPVPPPLIQPVVIPPAPPKQPPVTQEPPVPAEPVTPTKPKLAWTPTQSPGEDSKSPIQTPPPPKTGWQPRIPPAGGFTKKTNKGPDDKKEPVAGFSELDKKRIGLWAEEHVLWKLIKTYQEEHREDLPKLEDFKNGTRRITLEKSQTVVDYIWNNDPILRPQDQKDDESWDSGQHYDIEIKETKAQAATIVKRIEVKGTVSERIHFFLQGLEWRTLLQNPANYHVYVVTKVGSEDAVATIYDNFLQALQNQQIVPISATEFRSN